MRVACRSTQWWATAGARLAVPGAQRLDGAAQHDHLARHVRVNRRVVKAAGRRPAVLQGSTGRACQGCSVAPHCMTRSNIRSQESCTPVFRTLTSLAHSRPAALQQTLPHARQAPFRSALKPARAAQVDIDVAAYVSTLCQFHSLQSIHAARLDIRQAQVEADGLRQQRQQRALLQLVVQDGCVAGAPASHAGGSRTRTARPCSYKCTALSTGLWGC